MKKVIVILGPTGVGKTKLSIEIAKQVNGEIISGDSIQVYRRLDIGSAKIKPHEMMNIKHHLIDILDYGEEYSVCDYQRMVREKIEEIDVPIICGGTGLYIDAAIRDYRFDGVKRNDDFEKQYEDMSNEDLYKLLLEKDPKATTIHMNNRKRVLRALEIALNSDKSITDNDLGHNLIYDCLIFGLTMDREILYDRINKRVDLMINEGLLDEVKTLYDEGIIVDAIGYKEFVPYFKGFIDLDKAIEDVKKNSRHYAKRQLTWFNRNKDIEIIDCLNEEAVSNCLKKAYEFIKEKKK